MPVRTERLSIFVLPRNRIPAFTVGKRGNGLRMSKKKTKGNILKIIIIFAVLALLVGGYYFYLSNKKRPVNEEPDVQSTAVQEVLMRSLEHNYPPTPKEVVKYYSEITKCFYNESYTDDELVELAVQAQGLYDAELIANKSQELYLADLRADVIEMKNKNCTISSYTTSSSVDIENSKFTQDGYEWAKVYCYYTLKAGGETSMTTELFLLRKDENGYWKIYGWELAD